MSERKTLKIEVTGREEHLSELAYFLRKAEFLGNVGSSRTLHLFFDGDGAARLKVVFPDIQEKIPVLGFDNLKEGEKESWDEDKNYKFCMD